MHAAGDVLVKGVDILSGTVLVEVLLLATLVAPIGASHPGGAAVSGLHVGVPTEYVASAIECVVVAELVPRIVSYQAAGKFVGERVGVRRVLRADPRDR